MHSAFARILNRILSENRFTVQEIAAEAGCSDRHIYNVRSGEAGLDVEKAERVCRWLCAHGETRLASAFLCPEYEIVRRRPGEANGTLDDEVADLVSAAAASREAHQGRDGDTLRRSIAELRGILARFEAEADRI